MIYDLGDGAELRHKVYNSDGVLTAATVVLVVTKPDGTTTSLAVSASSTGVYDASTFTVDQAGLWSYEWTVSGAVTDVASGSFTVADPAPASYVSRDTVKAALGKTSEDDRDELIDAAIEAASRMIEDRCSRRFYRDQAASARTFDPFGRTLVDGHRWTLLVDDFATATGLIVETGSDANGWASVGTVEAGPRNATVYGRAFTQVRLPYGWAPVLWPDEAFRVTARWGWPDVPAGIVQATSLLAARLYRRKDSPQGVLVSADWGGVRVSRVDPDVEALIAPYARGGFA